MFTTFEPARRRASSSWARVATTAHWPTFEASKIASSKSSPDDLTAGVTSHLLGKSIGKNLPTSDGEVPHYACKMQLVYSAKAFDSRRLHNDINAVRSMLAWIACSLRKTDDNMATPCSVNT
jgi:hypothetical protein